MSKSKGKVKFSLLPFLEFVLEYSKAPMAATEQRLNLNVCVCPLWHRRDANTWPSALVWFTPTRYALRHRGKHMYDVFMSEDLTREASSLVPYTYCFIACSIHTLLSCFCWFELHKSSTWAYENTVYRYDHDWQVAKQATWWNWFISCTSHQGLT